MKIFPDPVRPGQESVWSYPRPAVAEATERLLRIVHRGVVVAETRRGLRTLETSHPPSYYFPRADVDTRFLHASLRRSRCEWKGEAIYFDVAIGKEVFADAAWSYPDPTPDFRILADHVAFFAAPFEACFVDAERVTPQAGGFYGGWITAQVAGPFKGGPGTAGW